MNELDINQDGRVEFVEFMRPTAKKFKEEQELERGADADRYEQHICKYCHMGIKISFTINCAGLSSILTRISTRNSQLKRSCIIDLEIRYPSHVHIQA